MYLSFYLNTTKKYIYILYCHINKPVTTFQINIGQFSVFFFAPWKLNSSFIGVVFFTHVRPFDSYVMYVHKARKYGRIAGKLRQNCHKLRWNFKTMFYSDGKDEADTTLITTLPWNVQPVKMDCDWFVDVILTTISSDLSESASTGGIDTVELAAGTVQQR